MNILLSPHNDDETLFASYICLRYNPLIIVCLRSFVEAEQWGNGATWEIREAETAAAVEILNCEWVQYTYRDDSPDWTAMKRRLQFEYDEKTTKVWAPYPEVGGHEHHNIIGRMAQTIFQDVEYYTTYTHAKGRTTSDHENKPQPGWEDIKRQAMKCYVSQSNDPRTQAAFNLWPINEYLAQEPSDD